MPHPRDDLLAEIATLRTRVEELEAEVEFMREQFAIPDAEHMMASLLGIPPWLSPALHLFLARQLVTTRQLIVAADEMDWTTADRYPHIAVHRLRQYLSPEGIHIETLKRVGYQTTPENYARLKALIN